MENKLYASKLSFVLFFITFLFFTNVITAQKTSTGSTDWNLASTWSPVGVPGPSDSVIIRPGDIVTVNTTPNSIASLTFSNTGIATSGITIASGSTLTVTGAVTLLNSQVNDTNASISGLGTLLCGSLSVGMPALNTTGGTFFNTLTLNISTLTVSGDIISNNDDPGGKSSQPIWNINSPCNLSANSIIFSHTGSASAGQTKSYFNVGTGVTVSLAAAEPIVVDYNINNFRSSMITVTVDPNSTFNFCGSSTVPTSIPNSGGTTNTNLLITYGITNTGNDITLTSGAGTNSPTTPVNVNMLNITYATTGATGATFSGLPPGVTGSWSSGVVTISGIPTSVGVFNYTVTTIAAGGCAQKFATGTITTYVCPTFNLLSTVSSSVNVCLGSSSLVTLTSTSSGLPVGSYLVSYEIQGVIQTPSPMTVVSAGTGSFVDSGFTSVGSRTITITNIASGLCSSAINTNNIATVTVVASLAAPTALSGSGATCSDITANWQAMADATYYELDVSTSSTFASFVTGYNALNVGLVTSYTVSGLTAGITYYYRVRAFNGLCISSNSGTITYATTIIPGTVTSSAATLATCVGFTANWTATANATSYLLDVSISNVFIAGSFVGIYNGFDVGNVTTLAITGLTPGTIYYYRVKAKNGCGSSVSFSSTRNTTTSSTIPGTVTSNAATLISCDRFTANWASLASATSYLLDVSTSSIFAAGNFVGAYNSFDVGNITSLQLTGLATNTQYFYRVKAKNGCGVSASFSTTRNLTTSNTVPGTVTSNTATLISCDGFTANWTAIITAPAAASYLLDISTSNVFAAGNFVGSYNSFDVGNITSLAVSGLASGTTYYYRIKAVNSCGSSIAFSTVRSAVIPSTLPGTVISNIATLTTCDSFSANWTALAAATNYLLDVSTSSTFVAGSFVNGFNNFDVGNVTSITISGLSSNTLYYYRVKAENGCGISAAYSTTRSTTTLTLPTTPTISASGPLTFCQTDSVTLGSTAATTYQWFLNGSPISGATSQFLFVSTAGIYTVQVTNASGCLSDLSLPITTSTQGLPTATAGGSQTICSNGVAIVSGASATNGTIMWTENGAGAITAGATTLTPTYTPAAGDIGNTVTLTMTVTSNNTCAPQIETASYSITVTPAIVAPTISTITQPTSCSLATGSVLLIGLPTSGIINPGNISYSGTSYTVTGLTPGIYNFTVTNGTCTSPASVDVLINPVVLIDNIWSSSGWSTGSPPNSDTERIIFDNSYSSTQDLKGCSCQINSGKSVIINSGHNLTLTNEITNYGALTIENSASLIQINDNAINSGNIIIKRTSRPMYRWDYVYHGSPVINDVISQIPSQYDLRYKYVTNKTVTGTWTPITTSTVGEGFITRVRNIAPFNTTPTSIDFNYVGVPNNGVISVTGTTYDGGLTTAYGNSKLLANPYPCALDAQLFLDDPNNKLFIGGTIYMWTSNSYYIGIGSYSQADYASWNKTGSTGGLPPPGLTPDGKIASGQGFMVQMIADGTLNFKNYMRISGYNNNFFRFANHALETRENHRIWLNITNENSFRQTLIGYVDGATNEEDRSYDGMTLSNSKIDLYSLLNKKELTIQGRALPFDVNDSVDLGFKTSVAGKLTIAIDHVDGLFLENQEIYLEDKILNIIHDLKQNPYEFTSDIGTFNNRFVLRYANSTLGTSNPNSKIGLTALIFNKKIMVHAAKKIKKIEIYDMTSKLIKEYTPKMSVQFFEDDFSFAQGIYLAKVRFENDSISTQKLTNNN